MRLRLFSTAILLSSIGLVPHAFAATIEPDFSLERKAFETVNLSSDGASAEDPADDTTTFSRLGKDLPSPSVDLRSLAVSPGSGGWLVTFTVESPIPDDPQNGYNFDLFADADGLAENNAPDGVIRTGVDRVFLLLFGLKTKWHTLWWKYDPPSGRWQQGPGTLDFSVDGTSLSMTIPYDLLPADAAIPVRGFSLTGTGGITVVDVIPGNGFPPLLAPTADSSAPPASAPASGRSPIPLIFAFIVIAGIAGFAVRGHLRGRKKKEGGQ